MQLNYTQPSPDKIYAPLRFIYRLLYDGHICVSIYDHLNQLSVPIMIFDMKLSE